MTFADIIRKLYGDDIQQIVNILNASIYVTEGLYNSEDTCIHTGFSFVNHKDKKFEILYNGKTEVLYRQPRNLSENLPLIIGLLVGKENSQFFNSFNAAAILEISELDNGKEDGICYRIKNPEMFLNEKPILSVEVQESENQPFIEASTFKILNKKKDQVFEFPLQKKLSTKIFYNGNTNLFERYISIGEYKRKNCFEDDDIYDSWDSSNSSFYDATDGQLGELGEEGWTSIGRD